MRILVPRPREAKEIIAFLHEFPTKPGIYKMLDADSKVLYVGKAKNLRNRLRSYFKGSVTEAKTRVLLSKVVAIEVTITSSENEALLLEINLIKTLRPRYNILFKDDKSYPYLMLSEHDFPRLSIYRGATKKGAKYFGPFPGAVAVHDTLNLLQKIFKLRTCTDTVFKHRARPCMQCQIKRCSAPCVGRIDAKDYQRNVKFVELFLSGKSNEVIESIIKLMEEAAAKQDYETAAYYRDQIANLKKIQQQQFIIKGDNNVDVIALTIDAVQRRAVVNVTFVRGGAVLGGKNYFPKLPLLASDAEIKGEEGIDAAEILTTFLAHYYLGVTKLGGFPDKIVLDRALSGKSKWEEIICQQLNHKIKIVDQAHSAAVKKWLEIATLNAEEGLSKITTEAKIDFQAQFAALRDVFGLDHIPARIECFDVSHFRGEATVAACVVFNQEGPAKDLYRKFNIRNVTLGDDYGALKEALIRHFCAAEGKPEILPDVLLIDGGKGQLAIARKVLDGFGLRQIFLIAIAKGAERKAGEETIFIGSGVTVDVSQNVLHLLQQIRDEAHRFAIQSQRRKLIKRNTVSVLENISGIGKAKSQSLLKHFGGLEGLKNASVEDLAKIPGIDAALARRIYEFLHGN